MSRPNTVVLIACLAAGVVFVALLVTRRPRLEYARSVAETLERGPSGFVRMKGWMPRDSLCKVNGECEYHLRLEDHAPQDGAINPGAHVLVAYRGCTLPETARCASPGKGAEVTVEGVLEDTDEFVAAKVFFKCGGPYELRDSYPEEETPVPSCK